MRKTPEKAVFIPSSERKAFIDSAYRVMARRLNTPHVSSHSENLENVLGILQVWLRMEPPKAKRERLLNLAESRMNK